MVARNTFLATIMLWISLTLCQIVFHGIDSFAGPALDLFLLGRFGNESVYSHL